MRRTANKDRVAWTVALAGVLVGSLSAFGMDPDDMKTDHDTGAMMQGEHMSSDAMIKKGEEMIAQGTALKKKGMMMRDEAMKKGDMMKDEDMMKDKAMKDQMK